MKNSIVINGAGVDISTFQPSFEEEGCVNILFMGRLLRDKGIIEFLEAAKGLKKSFGETVNFLVLGDVDSNPTSIKPEEIEGYVHQKIIQWHGYQEDIKEFLKMASVVCLPSYREGLPMALLEGASAGKPLVATNVPGCKEVIIDGTNGFLVKRECVLSLEKALARLVKDKALRDRMGKASRKLAESRFSSLVIFPRIESVYQNTLVR